jgi:uncharacterized protein (DUF1786 family)
MRVLAADIGTGTQDVLLFDSEQELENAVQLILPSPTMVVGERIRAATRRGQAVVLDGVTMGGGPCAWAAEDHLRAGLPLAATPAAARTFDDDLSRVAALGVRIVGEDEVAGLVAGGAARVTMRDFDPEAILAAVAGFGVDPRVDALAVAVFDHGNAPPDVSDRRFRFDYLAQRLAAGGRADLGAFAFLRDAIPPEMTRLAAAARSPGGALADLPLLAMDTGPAAVLGALEDPAVAEAAQADALVVNVGNFHTLAFRLAAGQVVGLFEHHTGELTPEQLAHFLTRLADGTLTNDEIFHSQGHGALVDVGADGAAPVLCAVTGPRRAMLPRLPWPVYPAVPHGDMMLTGCFGLLRALARHLSAAQEAITRRLDLSGN